MLYPKEDKDNRVLLYAVSHVFCSLWVYQPPNILQLFFFVMHFFKEHRAMIEQVTYACGIDTKMKRKILYIILCIFPVSVDSDC